MPDFGRWSNGGGDPSLNEVNRTDRFLDALASEQPVYSTDSSEAELAYLMAGWRDDVRHTPATSVTMRDAAAALDRSAGSRQHRRASMAILGSVAAAVLAVGGFGAVIAGAGPDDPLYGLRTTLFGAPAPSRDDQVVLAAQSQLAEVQQLIDQGDWQTAQSRLQTMTTTVAAVDDSARQQELVDQWQQMSVKVETRDVNATLPPDAPPLVLPEVPPDLPLPLILDPNATSTSISSSTSRETPGPTSSTTSSTTSPTTSPTEPAPGEPSPSSPLPTPSSALPTPSAPLPTPSAPLPTPSAPLPTPSAPLPTPSAPLPTTQPPTTQPPTTTTTTTTAAPPPPVQPPPVDEPQAEEPPAPEPVEEPAEQPRLRGEGSQNGPAQTPVTTPPALQLPEIVVPEVAAPDGGE